MRKKLLHVCMGIALFFSFLGIADAQNMWINEIHYDNAGTDANESIEVAVDASIIDLANIRVMTYNGEGVVPGASYATYTLDATTPGTTVNGIKFFTIASPGLQNGPSDGISLAYNGSLVLFISYEGTLTASDGDASGQLSTDIGLAEDGLGSAANSLQLTGTGTSYADFAWTLNGASTFGNVNTGQTIQADVPSNQANILAFSLSEQTAPATIDTTNATVTIDVLSGTSLTGLIPTITLSSGATVSPASDVAHDFTDGVAEIYVVTAENTIATKNWSVKVSVATVSSNADILSFSFAEQTGAATIDTALAIVNIEVVFGTSLTSQVPTITVSPGASINPASSVANNFSTPATYIVTAQDSSTKSWTVTVSIEAVTPIHDIQYTIDTSGDSPLKGQQVLTGGIVTGVSSAGYFIQSGFGSWNGVYVYSTANSPAIGDSIAIKATVEEYYKLTELKTVTSYTLLSSGNLLPGTMTISTADVAEQYEGILARIANGSCTRLKDSNGVWTVNSTATPADTLNVDNDMFTYTPVLSQYYDITGTISYSFGAFKILPRDSSDVKKLLVSTVADILSFQVEGQDGSEVINNTDTTVIVAVVFGTDISDLAPNITVSTGATISPLSGISQDFTSGFAYTVTAANGTTTKVWNITVAESAASTEADILTFAFAEQTSPATINSTDTTVTVEVLYGSTITSLTPTITISQGAAITPASGIAQDFISTVNYTVTAADTTSYKTWKVTVNEAAVSTNAEILTFSLTEQTGPAVINSGTSTVVIEVAMGTSLTNIVPAISVSPGATINPASGIAHTFTDGTPEVYTVTAQDNSTIKAWNVTVNVSTTISYTPIYDIQYTTSVPADSPLKGQSVTTKGIVTGKMTDGYFIQDSSCAWCGVYIFDNVHAPLEGDEVLITGTVDEFYEFTEIKNLTSYQVLSQGNLSPAPVSITTVQVAEAYESTLVKVVAPCSNNTLQYGMYEVNDTSGPALVDDVWYATTPAPVLSTSYEISGVVYYSYSEWKILPRNENDVIQASTLGKLANIVTITIPQQAGAAMISAVDAIVALDVTVGTPLTSLIPTITVSSGATISPASGVAQDFTGEVIYTVTSQDLSLVRSWKVNVTAEDTSSSKTIYKIQYTILSSGDSPLKNQTVTTKGIVSGLMADGYFIQDAVGAWSGIYILDTISTPPHVGDEVSVTGVVAEFYNFTEIKANAYTLLSVANTPYAAAYWMPTGEVGEKYESVLIKAVNATCLTLPSPDSYGMWTIDDGSGPALVDDVWYSANPTVNNSYDIIGIVYYSYSEWKILPRQASDVAIYNGIDDVNGTFANISIYPNPTTSSITLSQISDITTISMFDQMGREYYNISNNKSNNVEFNVEHLASGLYMIKCFDKSGNYMTARFVKN